MVYGEVTKPELVGMDLGLTSYYANMAALGVVAVLWFVFAAVILLRKRPDAPPDARRSPVSWIGLVLQLIGMAMTWATRRMPTGSPIITGRYTLNIVLAIVAASLAAGSVWLALMAVRELGKQWSLAARLIEGHKLITGGVYGMVRHPIYTAMLGMLVAAGLVFSNWIGLITAMFLFCVGTKIRTIYEERLLSEAFGKEFAVWKAKVPALIPFVKI